jgi:hypothetical protein
MKVPALLKNKYVFYGLAALAVLNVVGYASVRAWECLALFVLTAYSAHCYCKNESCAILVALFVANFVFGCGRVKEGMEDALAGAPDHLENAKEELNNAAAKCGDHDTEEKCKAMADECQWTGQVCKEKEGMEVAAEPPMGAAAE